MKSRPNYRRQLYQRTKKHHLVNRKGWATSNCTEKVGLLVFLPNPNLSCVHSHDSVKLRERVHHSDFEWMYVIYFVKNKEKIFVSFFFDLAGWSASTFLNIVKSWTKSAQLNRYLSNNHGFKLDWPRNKLVIIMTSSGIPGLMVVSTGQVPDILGLIPYYCPSPSHGFESWLELDFLLTFCLRN